MTAKQGFTLVELMVALLLSTMLVVGVISSFISVQHGVRAEDDIVDLEQNARVGIEFLTRDIKLAGLNIDRNAGQPALVDLAPYHIVFNADIHSNVVDPGGPGIQPPAIVDPDLPFNLIAAASGTVIPRAGAQPAYVAPAVAPQFKAETIRYSFDTNGDFVVDGADSDLSFNPFDFVLTRSVTGAEPLNPEIADEPIAFGLRAVTTVDTSGAYPNNELPLPLFQYWIAGIDPTGGCGPAAPELIWGDANADGRLDNGEIQSLLSSPFEGAVVLDSDGDNDEDDNQNGILDLGEDCNANGRLDTALLDLHVTRILITTTSATRTEDPGYLLPERSVPGCTASPDCYRFRERTFQAAIAPRNSGEFSLFSCPGPPSPPAPPVPLVTCVGVSGRILGQSSVPVAIEWLGSPDDGGGEDDVIGYAIYRDDVSKDPQRDVSEDNHLSWHVTRFSWLEPAVPPASPSVSARVLNHPSEPMDPCSGGVELYSSGAAGDMFDLEPFAPGWFALCVELLEGGAPVDSAVHLMQITAPSPVPALQGWGMALLVALMIGFAARRLGRRAR